MAVAFSMKLAVFHEIGPFFVKFREIRDFSAFTFICEGFHSFCQQLLCGFCCLLSYY